MPYALTTWPLNRGKANIWTVSSETRYLYDGMRVIQERNASNVPQVTYTRGSDLSGSLEGAGGIGGLLGRSHAYQTGSGNWTNHNFYHADGNGNVTFMLISAQSRVAEYVYDPYGNTISSAGTLATANVYGFSSKEVNADSGLYYYGYRFYDPHLQRWLNRDPVWEYGGINLYACVGNNPTRFIDSFGLDVGGRVGPGSPSDGYPHTAPPIKGKPSGGNCLGYACGFPCIIQPDGKEGGKNAKKCEDLMNQIKANHPYVIDTRPDGNCAPDYHKITVRADGDGGYHVKRQDGDGNWSEASIGGPDDTYAPHKCRKCGGPGTSCGDLCARNQ